MGWFLGFGGFACDIKYINFSFFYLYFLLFWLLIEIWEDILVSLDWFNFRMRDFLLYFNLINFITFEFAEYKRLWFSILLQILESTTSLYKLNITITISSFNASASYIIFSLGFSLIVLPRIYYTDWSFFHISLSIPSSPIAIHFLSPLQLDYSYL